MKKSLVIVGAGAWGSALAIALSDKFEEIFLIANNKKFITKLGNKHPALTEAFPSNIVLSADISLVKNTRAILIAAPSYSFSEILFSIKPYLNSTHSIAWATKGFDPNDKCLLHETFQKILPEYHPCAISGPTFAAEIAKKKPSAIVVASKDYDTREFWADAIQTELLRAYKNNDIVGVEVGGSVKNVLAIAAGIANGLEFGANTQAALITRGLAEMTRLGVSLGAEKITFQGLSGIGDLVLTCSDDLSRNRRFGKELANNASVNEALKVVGATVEGLNALKIVISIANKLKIEMPICDQVMAVTEGKIKPADAVKELLLRKPIQE